MQWMRNRRITIGGLVLLIAVVAVGLSLLRPIPPDEGQAIMLAKAHLAAANEFEYPGGYLIRTEWNPKIRAWRVGFTSAAPKKGGYTVILMVRPDRTCRSAPMDFAFFDGD